MLGEMNKHRNNKNEKENLRLQQVEVRNFYASLDIENVCKQTFFVEVKTL
jgi:hypothetical protein